MKKIRIGVFGVKRGSAFFDAILQCDGDLVAICDGDPVALAEAKKKVGDNVVAYDKFEDFFNHPMDAVFLANYFNEHAQYAVRYLEKGIHVLSECTAAATMADCVALVRAAEKSTAKYMLAENYPFMKFNRELKRICDGGTLGRILYAEGEYNHPVSGADTDRRDTDLLRYQFCQRSRNAFQYDGESAGFLYGKCVFKKFLGSFFCLALDLVPAKNIYGFPNLIMILYSLLFVKNWAL